MRRHSYRVFFLAAWIAGADAVSAADAGPASGDDLYEAGRQLFEQYAPPEVKTQYEFPSKAQFDAFLAKLDAALESGSFQDLAAYEPQARAALPVLRQLGPEYAGMADWLAARLDEMEVAGEVAEKSPAPASPPYPATIPYYEKWVQRVRARPIPANAAELMPRLRTAFASEGVAPELAWLAEVESSLNPSARSPSGARGLFQLKAETARGLGLSTFLPDERTDPDKSAHAAARSLRHLREKFGSWPLALAAYNAGEGRISRLLASRQAHDFADVAPGLPAATRMYVPEVCAVVAARTGLAPDKIPPPK